MATIQDKLNILASTTEAAASGGSLTQSELEQEKGKAGIVDYKMVSFSLAGKDYAIDIMKVKEIAKAGYFTYVPNTLPFVLGVYNLRGEIIPIIDLRRFFNITVEERKDDSLENMLIVTVGEQVFGVVVDAIDKVVGIQKSSIQPPHPLFGDINIKYISGVVEAQQHLYVLLDIDRIFGLRTAEEQQELQDAAKAQLEQRQAMAAEVAAQEQKEFEQRKASDAAEAKRVQEEEAKKQESVDLNFIADSLKNKKKFILSAVNEDWVKTRYMEWKEERGSGNTQLQNDTDVDSFLKPFYSSCTGDWWTEQYADEVYKLLPDNSAKNILVWNPGCGKGFESYSLACLLKKKYPNSHVRVYAHDIDLLSVSNAPLMTVSGSAASSWYAPYLTKTVSGDWTFSKEIKDMVMFEYHDCVNTNNLPPIDIIFARDIISFLPQESQKTITDDFGEKVKGNGTIIVGDNEKITLSGWNRRQTGNLALYSK